MIAIECRTVRLRSVVPEILTASFRNSDPRRKGSAAAAVAARFVADGGRLLFGSDTPSAPTYANPPGYNAYLELLNLVRAGIPAKRVFEAATIDNARFFRIDADYGTVETGKRASLLLLRANPLDGPAAFDTVETVIVGGRAVPRAELAADRESALPPVGPGAPR
jgi:imidazolonepropionase-like amidohydrolase